MCHKSQNIKGRDPQGFTLIELLVVIAIIAILAAVLIPTISKIRSSSSKAECVSRIRQLVIASKAYGNEHQGRPPYPAVINGNPSYGHAPHRYAVAAFNETLRDYLGNRFDTMHCPGALSDDPNGTYDPEFQRNSDNPNDFVSYQYFHADSNGSNATGNPLPEYNFLFKSMINAPEGYAMWGCLTYTAGTRSFGHVEGRSSSGTIAGMNAGYADGSVRWVPFEQLEAFSGDGSYLWPEPINN